MAKKESVVDKMLITATRHPSRGVFICGIMEKGLESNDCYQLHPKGTFVEMQQEKLLITPKDPAESNRVHSLCLSWYCGKSIMNPYMTDCVKEYEEMHHVISYIYLHIDYLWLPYIHSVQQHNLMQVIWGKAHALELHFYFFSL